MADIGFRDLQEMLFFIDILRGERQQLADADAAPVEQFEGGEHHGLILEFPDEGAVLRERPELHGTGVARTDMLRFGAGIGKVIILCGVFEDGGQVHVNGFEIGVPIAAGEQSVLPVADDLGCDGMHGKGAKGGKYLVADDGILVCQCRLLQAALHISVIDPVKIRKKDVRSD